jgi:hypothetical protein
MEAAYGQRDGIENIPYAPAIIRCSAAFRPPRLRTAMNADALNSDKAHAQHLLDQLAPDQVAAVVHVMEVMLDPLSRKLANAPPEDEEIYAEEERTAEQAREWLKNKQAIPHEDVLSEPGLTMADFERMGRTPRGPANAIILSYV